MRCTNALLAIARKGRYHGNLMASSLHASSQSESNVEQSSSSDDGFHQIYDKTLVTIQQCRDALNNEEQQRQTQPKIVFVDGSWYHRPDPTTGLLRNPSLEFSTGPRLPNARYVDIDAIATTNELFPEQNPKGLPHMMPPPKLFVLAMDAYNIGNDDHVIIYARRGALFTPRVWFLFMSMGHDPKRLHLMQGSLEDYAEEGGGSVETHSLMGTNDQYSEVVGKSCINCFDQGILNTTRLYHAYYSTTKPQYHSNVTSATNICGKIEVLEAINDILDKGNSQRKITKESFKKAVILDTRGSGYAKKGHMPSAIHLPYTKIATAANSLVMNPKTELKKLFEERGVDYSDPELKIILSCGSGVSVCHGYLALKELGRDITEENTRIYDGSWAEWGKEDGLPKVLPDEK
eukprot:CAMPEP_0183731770 /NCGR_PEP_ID=MMETSP0737-20130205/36377_1 /TAXON_ID=385413 /ORGANISM="Thalassiosira miniscula, Strain CCMP1093" /LENGTH=404 /DNA_ID=CAMNT_0025964587 /DNA_START=147 /DNA_END=1361 /DNA_ORIENTATION=-